MADAVAEEETKENLRLIKVFKECVKALKPGDRFYEFEYDDCIIAIITGVRGIYLKQVRQIIQDVKEDDIKGLAAKIKEQEQLNADLLKVKAALLKGIFD